MLRSKSLRLTILPATVAAETDTVAARATSTTVESTATAAIATTAATTATATAVHNHLADLRRNLLLCFAQNAHQFTSVLRILRGEKGDGHTLSACTSCTANLMDVVFGVSGEIIVDHCEEG